MFSPDEWLSLARVQNPAYRPTFPFSPSIFKSLLLNISIENLTINALNDFLIFLCGNLVSESFGSNPHLIFVFL